MKKILVLFTGGTIGSNSDNGVINVSKNMGTELINAYCENFHTDVKFECRQILNILSENILFPHWERLIEILCGVDCENYSGIIIAHGSDTLCYTSALIGMFFRHIEIPVYIIASNRPINEKGSNGLFNFAGAVNQIIESEYNGVFTLYEKVYMPTRIMPADHYCDRFHSFGEDSENEFTLFRGISEKALRKKREKLFDKPIEFTNHIMKIYGYPGIDFSQFNPAGRTPAVLYVPYHSGTACTTTKYGEQYSLCEFIKKCLINDVKVYICGLKRTENMYETLHKIIETGAIPLYNISDVSAYMKLLIAYNQTDYPVGEIMRKNLYFEIV